MLKELSSELASVLEEWRLAGTVKLADMLSFLFLEGKKERKKKLGKEKKKNIIYTIPTDIFFFFNLKS